jgi:hypothetical protein
MACLSCGSECQTFFNAELALSFPELKDMTINPPLYMVLRTPVCLHCGFVDLRIPDGELIKLRGGSAGIESKSVRTDEPFQTISG